MKIIATESFRVPGTNEIIEKGQTIKIVGNQLLESEAVLKVITYGGNVEEFTLEEVEEFVDGDKVSGDYAVADNVPKWIYMAILSRPSKFANYVKNKKKPTTIEILQYIIGMLTSGVSVTLNVDSKDTNSNGIVA